MYRCATPAVLTWLALFLVGCAREGSHDGVYPIKGAVIALDTAKGTVELDHEQVADVMAAMDMTYAVADPKLLRGLKPGDSVEGRLKLQSGNYTITTLAK